MSKATEAIANVLRRTPAGRAMLDAGKAEEQRLEARKMARKDFEAAEAEITSLPELEEEVEKAAAAYEVAVRKAQERLAAARRAYQAAASGSGRRRRKAEVALRRTAPDAIAEEGPIVSRLQAALDHVRTHLSVELGRHREFLRDYENAGKPKADEAAARAARRIVQTADRALELLPAIEEALERVREVQLIVEPDVGALVGELLEDVLVETCTACDHEFGFAELAGPELAGPELVTA